MKTMMEVVMDVGPSMKDNKKLELAKAFVGHFMLQRMMATKTMEFGVLAFGSDRTKNYLNASQGGYEHVQEVVSMERPSAATLAAVEKILPGSVKGDLIDGIVAGQDVLMRVNANKAFNRILLVITDGETKVEGVEDLEAVLAQMTAVKNFGLYIALIGAVGAGSSVAKKENAKLLRSMAEQAKGRCAEVQCLGDSFQLLSAGLGLSTKPTLSKTVLEITPALRIRAAYWSKVSKASPPSLKKRSLAAMEGMDSAVKRDTSYRNPADPDQEVPAEERVKGYKYGTQYIPLSAADEDMIKVGAPAGITVIGAVPFDRIPRQHLLDAPMFLHGAVDSEDSQAAIATIAAALHAEDLVLLARMVKRDNSDPYTACLVPSIPPEGDGGFCCLLMFRLPCAEDVRDLSFPSLITFASQKTIAAAPALQGQVAAMSSFIDSMTVTVPGPGLLTPTNPSLHSIYDDLHRRLLLEQEVVTHGQHGGDSMTCPLASDQAALRAAEALLAAFPLSKQESSKGKGKKVFWSDIQLTAGGAEGGGATQTQTQGATPAMDMAQMVRALEANAAAKAAEAGWEANLPEFAVGSVTPVEDFTALLAALAEHGIGHREEVSQKQREALINMTRVADRNILIGASRSHYKRSLTCLMALREAAISLNMADIYNTYMLTVKAQYRQGRHALVFQLLQQESVTLISQAEAASSDVSAEVKTRYLSEEAAAVQEVAIPKDDVADDADDLFGDMA